MLKAHVAVAYPQADWSEVICLGCDEMSVRKGQNYASVFCDLIGKRVLFAVYWRDKSVWKTFAKVLEEHSDHPRAIREISMDMSPLTSPERMKTSETRRKSSSTNII